MYIGRTPTTGLAVASMALPVLHLSEISPDGVSLSCAVQAEDLALDPEDAVIPGGLALEVRAVKMGTTVYVTGTLSGIVRRQCVRCLADYDDPLRLVMTGEYHRDTDLKGQPAVWTSPERSMEEENDDIYSYTGDTIELGEMLREQVILAAPMQPLCREECLGLCPVCGQDLNVRRCECREEPVASPFTALKTLRDTLGPTKRTTNKK